MRSRVRLTDVVTVAVWHDLTMVFVIAILTQAGRGLLVWKALKTGEEGPRSHRPLG